MIFNPHQVLRPLRNINIPLLLLLLLLCWQQLQP
jgi:hypothetical protein